MLGVINPPSSGRNWPHLSSEGSATVLIAGSCLESWMFSEIQTKSLIWPNSRL